MGVDVNEHTPSEIQPSNQTTLKRHPERGHFDRALINSILDEAIVSHVGITANDGSAVVIPTLHVRRGDELLLHGSAASRLLRSAQASQICVTITIVDGLVLAQTAFHHSLNYRSVVIFGTPKKVTDLQEADAALNYFVDGLIPGRMADMRPNTEKEIRATTVLSLPISEASAKVRTGPPSHDPDEETSETWTGVIPITTRYGHPKTSIHSNSHLLPDYVSNYERPTP